MSRNVTSFFVNNLFMTAEHSLSSMQIFFSVTFFSGRHSMMSMILLFLMLTWFLEDAHELILSRICIGRKCIDFLVMT